MCVWRVFCVTSNPIFLCVFVMSCEVCRWYSSISSRHPLPSRSQIVFFTSSFCLFPLPLTRPHLLSREPQLIFPLPPPPNSSSIPTVTRYLHTLFTRIPERYNTQQEFAEYHLMQIPLHARFAPSFKRQEKTEIKKYNDFSLSNKSRKNVDLDPFLESTSPSSSSAKNSKSIDSDFLHFLKNSAFVVLEIALRECEKRKPPLFPEMIYILGKLGNFSVQ